MGTIRQLHLGNNFFQCGFLGFSRCVCYRTGSTFQWQVILKFTKKTLIYELSGQFFLFNLFSVETRLRWFCEFFCKNHGFWLFQKLQTTNTFHERIDRFWACSATSFLLRTVIISMPVLWIFWELTGEWIYTRVIINAYLCLILRTSQHC